MDLPEFGDLSSQLDELVEPRYVTVSMDEAGEIDVSTNLDTDREVWTFLSAAMFDVMQGIRWQTMDGEDIEDEDDDED